MPLIHLETLINASREICFDLSRSIDLHKISTASTGEEAIAGVTKGLINLNESVTWQATHFGIKQKLTSRITEFNFPDYFVDEMIYGAFKSFRHEHRFITIGTHTKMIDIFHYISPLGLLGRLADHLFLTNYMTKLLMERNHVIKAYAESDKWKEILYYE